jgi:hypothetical protein
MFSRLGGISRLGEQVEPDREEAMLSAQPIPTNPRGPVVPRLLRKDLLVEDGDVAASGLRVQVSQERAASM